MGRDSNLLKAGHTESSHSAALLSKLPLLPVAAAGVAAERPSGHPWAASIFRHAGSWTFDVCNIM